MKKLLLLIPFIISILGCSPNQSKVKERYYNVGYALNKDRRVYTVVVEDKKYTIRPEDITYKGRESWDYDNEFIIYIDNSKLLIIYYGDIYD